MASTECSADANGYLFVAPNDRDIGLTRDLAVAGVRHGEHLIEFSPTRLPWPPEWAPMPKKDA